MDPKKKSLNWSNIGLLYEALCEATFNILRGGAGLWSRLSLSMAASRFLLPLRLLVRGLQRSLILSLCLLLYKALVLRWRKKV